MGKIANRQSLAILDRGLKSQPFSQFCCIGMFKTNRQSRVSNRSFKFESSLVYPYPKNTRNSDHGLSFPSPETDHGLSYPINTESGVV